MCTRVALSVTTPLPLHTLLGSKSGNIQEDKSHPLQLRIVPSVAVLNLIFSECTEKLLGIHLTPQKTEIERSHQTRPAHYHPLKLIGLRGRAAGASTVSAQVSEAVNK